MLLSLILFGSRARGDHRLNSDVDLLGVVEGGAIVRESPNRGANLFQYPLHLLRKMASEGDLFMLHVVKEGIALHDTAGIFVSLQEGFEFRESYDDTAKEAALVLWYLTARSSKLTRPKARKRLVWALRTLIIAEAANQKEAIFSAAGLEEFSGVSNLKKIIDRRNTVPTGQLVEAASAVAEWSGYNTKRLKFPPELSKQSSLMRRQGGICEDTRHLVLRPIKPRRRYLSSESIYGA